MELAPSHLLKLRIGLWLYLGICIAVQIKAATSSAPPGKGPWLLQWRLFTIAHVGIGATSAIHGLRHIASWTQAKRADWLFLLIIGQSPFQNLLLFFFLPTFDVTRATWSLLVVCHMLLSGLLLDMPPMHILLQLCFSLPFCLFLDFQKTLSLARSSQQLLLGSIPGPSAAAQAALDHGRCTQGPITCYILHQGLPMVLLGVAAAVIVSTVTQRNRRDTSADLAAQSSRKGDAAGKAQPPEDPDSAPPAAVPLESLGIYLLAVLGLRPCFRCYHSRIVILATKSQRVVMGAFCLPVSFYYFVRIVVSRFESTPLNVSAEELLVLIMCTYIVGRDSSKLDMSGILQHIQSRLVASQALLVDLLPAHLVTRMLNSIEEAEQQGQQQQGQQQHAAGRGSAQAAGPDVLSPARASAAAQRVKAAQVWRRRPARRASSIRRFKPAGAEQGSGPEAPAEPQPQEPWTRSRESSRMGHAVALESGVPRQDSFTSSLGLDTVHGGGSFLSLEGLVEGEGSAVTRDASSSNLSNLQQPPPPRPSLCETLGRNLSPSLWSSCQSQLSVQAVGLLGWGGSKRSSPGTHAAQDGEEQVQEHPEVLSGRTTAASHECVTLFFSDICGFSTWASKLPPEMVMSTLDDLYSRLDDLILNEFPGLYKVETVGDAYIVAANLLTPDPNHAATAVHFALRAQQETHKVPRPDRDDGETLEMRIGLHSGSIMSGIVGKIRRRFCLFGDTMNMAARTESSCPKGSIQLTAATYTLAQPSLRGEVSVRERGEVQVKGSDKPLMMFLASAPQHPQQDRLTLPDDQGNGATRTLAIRQGSHANMIEPW